jgi:ribosomal-protein-alanine N-acetyltransferase
MGFPIARSLFRPPRKLASQKSVFATVMAVVDQCIELQTDVRLGAQPMKIPKFVGVETDRLILQPFSEHHLTERYVSWLNDPQVVRFSKQSFKQHTLETCRQYYKSMKNSSDLFVAIIAKSPALGHIGNMTILFDQNHGLADVAIMVGEANARGRGFGYEAWSAMLDWLLDYGGVRKVIAGAVEKNMPMLKIVKRYGMQDDGTWKSHRIFEGKVMDVHFFAAFGASRRTSQKA